MNFYWNKSKYIVAFLIALFDGKSFSFTYNRPLPETVVLKDVSKIQDIYSFAISTQIHAPLFKLDENNIPYSYLVKHFEVSIDGLTYKFTLKDISFHDNEKLDSMIVLKSIEYYLLSREQTHEKLFSIAGAEEFSNGKNSHITGIVLNNHDSLSFIITLKYPDFNFIYKLADQRLSILKPSRDPKIGLGAYKIDNINNDTVILSKVRKTQSEYENTPNRIIYSLNIDKEKAISGFMENKYDDLSFYNLTQSDKEKIKPFAQYVTLYSPSVYTLILNANRIKNKNDRLQFFSAIDWDRLRYECYPNNNRAYSFMPPGFIGFKKEPSVLTKTYFEKIYNSKLQVANLKKNYKIMILKNLGSAECAKNIFQIRNKKPSSWTVEITPLLELHDKWQKDKIDAVFIWLEDISPLSFWGYFNPNGSTLFGVPNDNKFIEIYKKFDKSRNLIDKEKIAIEMDDHILNLVTAFPVFHPTVIIAYSNRFLPLNFGMRFSYSIPFSSFKLKKDINSKYIN